ncbi:MAG: helix-turn-helix transcriptional regulator [Oscillospiraceae bacterium]|nr:helix-turn-helix transcriptional regulator [Oscillospiraceae bacterium]
MKKDINVEIGARIKEKRKSFKYTRETLAELVDISPQFLANIESGKKGMSFTTLKKLCECLGISCDYVILGKEPIERKGRIYELIDNVDKKYIPLLETLLNDALHLITVARKDENQEN